MAELDSPERLTEFRAAPRYVGNDLELRDSQ
jgi:hypothetical protein